MLIYGLTFARIEALRAWWLAFGDGDVPEPTVDAPFRDVAFLRRKWLEHGHPLVVGAA